MKKIIILIFICSFVSVLHAQKHDYNWISGNSIGVPSSEYFLFSLNFNNNLQYIPLHEGDSTKIWMSNGYHSSFSNKEGELKFFSNGVRLYNSIYSIMENGDTLNPGWIWNESNKNKIGYQSSRGITALPSPGMPEKYSFLIHQGLDTSKSWYTFFFANPLYYSKIDMEANGGLGKVIEKNAVIDTGRFEPLSVVKHANGRDWWIIMPEMYFNRYHRLLLTPEGVKGPWIQEIGPNFPLDKGAFIPSEFSIAGDKFIRGWSANSQFALFDFDRCTGIFSNPNTFFFADTLIIHTIKFSPSGKYLYLNSQILGKLYQLDINSTFNPLIEIASVKNDQICQGYPVNFGFLANGPDGKIYISGGAKHKCISVINSPDKAFPDCDIQFSTIELASANSTFPYFPNYRLGPLIGSGCDTITSTIDINDSNPIAITYPNPASELITIELMKYLQHGSNLEVSLIDISGKLLYSGKIPPFAYIYQIDVKDLVAGMYCVLIRDKFKLLGSVKVLKQ